MKGVFFWLTLIGLIAALCLAGNYALVDWDEVVLASLRGLPPAEQGDHLRA